MQRTLRSRGHARAAIALALSLAALASPAAAYDRLPRALAAMSPSDFAARVRATEDTSTHIFSTSEAYRRGRSIAGAYADDVHLRALVDRRTGRVTWQVWHDLAYVGARKTVWAVSYASAGETRRSQPIHLDHWPDRCPPTDGVGMCNEAMRVAFELPEQTVREIAAAYRPGARTPWMLHFQDENGRDVTGGLAPAEAAGLLQAVDARRARLDRSHN